MTSRVTTSEPCLREIEVTVGEDAIKSASDRAVNEARTQVALPGFRAGKVPLSVIEKKFGAQLRHDVLHDLIRDGIGDALKEHSIEPVSEPILIGQEEGSPNHHLPTTGPLVFSFKVEVKAEFELPEYKGVQAQRKLAPVTDAHVDEVLQRLRERAARYEPVEEGGYQAGDLVLGTLTLNVGSTNVCTDQDVQAIADYPVVARGVRLVDAEKAFEAAVAGAVLEVEADITEAHATVAVRGKRAAGRLSVTALRRKKQAELDDALAKEMGQESLDALKADIRMRLEADQKAKSDRQVVTDILDALLTRVDIPVANSPIDRMIERRARELAGQLVQSGTAASEALNKARAECESSRADLERDTRKWLLVEKIAKKEKIFCLEDDLDEVYQRLAAEHDTTPSKAREHYEGQGLVAELRAEVVERKCCEFLSANARIADA